MQTTNQTLTNQPFKFDMSQLVDLNQEKEQINKTNTIPLNTPLFIEKMETKDYSSNKAYIVKFKDLDKRYYLTLKSYCEIIKKHANVVVYSGLLDCGEYKKHTFQYYKLKEQ